jgi:hypothetical protein
MPRMTLRPRAAHRVAILTGTGSRSAEWYAASSVAVLALATTLVAEPDPRLLTGTSLILVMFGLLRLRRAVTEAGSQFPKAVHLRR